MSTRIPSAGRPGATPPPEAITGAASRAAPSAPAGDTPADGIEVGAGDPVFVSGPALSGDDGSKYADPGGFCASLAAEAAVGLRALPSDDGAAFCGAIGRLFAELAAGVSAQRQ